MLRWVSYLREVKSRKSLIKPQAVCLSSSRYDLFNHVGNPCLPILLKAKKKGVSENRGRNAAVRSVKIFTLFTRGNGGDFNKNLVFYAFLRKNLFRRLVRSIIQMT